LKGIYYHQDIKDFDNASAWKAILAIDQDMLQFTSLQFEYSQIGEGFVTDTDPYAVLGFSHPVITVTDTMKTYGVWARQNWGDTRWNSWFRYYRSDYGSVGDLSIGIVDSFGVGIGYQLNPAVAFELAYGYAKFGSSDIFESENDHIIRFQTSVSF
jgi:hypothetical protein